MARKDFCAVILLLSLLVSMGAGVFVSGAVESSHTEKRTQMSCQQCHAKLSDIFPKGHVSVTGNEMKDCLICHASGSKTTSFELNIHIKHYGSSRFSGDCWSCHQIDLAGKFNIIGVEDRKGISTSKDAAEKMGTYFRSWGTSNYLDHKHARKGISCKTCHITFIPDEKVVSSEQCFQCHKSYEALGKKSSIHTLMTVPHFGGGNDCGRCHHAHKNSELLCIQCHLDMEMKVP